MMSIRNLMETNPIAFYELVMICRDSNHAPFGNTGDILRNFNLLNTEGKVHSSIRNIVISAVTGEGLEMTLGSPV